MPDSADGSPAQDTSPHNLAVTSVAPGFVVTERQATQPSDPEGERLWAESPFGTIGLPDEIAAALHFLASPAAARPSGTVVDLNGERDGKP
ncbi:SDR family oxidoreductase [Streptomyces sp. SID3343]|uniref:SDR family oxidoreductase n=1 Tax=Streptomyces sp. SID3343 TaxID=2690260 RepID=UPI0019270131|nr:SDR family oxidoreductase [Streptomyces sp. SID3343]